jgi:putative membrane protein
MSAQISKPRFVHALRNGAISGFFATAPMTVFMVLGWRLLPARERYLLPPQEITEEVVERLGAESHLNDVRRDTAALVLHFGYGALTGAAYGLLEPQMPLAGAIKGSLAGLAVWIGSYLGWLPALHILSPATHHPRRRNILMILAHIVWGATLGVLTQKLNSNKS